MFELQDFGINSWIENLIRLNPRAALNDLKYLPALDTLVVELRLVLNNQFFLRAFGALFHILT